MIFVFLLKFPRLKTIEKARKSVNALWKSPEKSPKNREMIEIIQK